MNNRTGAGIDKLVAERIHRTGETELGDLCTALNVPKSTMSRALRRLEAVNVVTLLPHPTDGRRPPYRAGRQGAGPQTCAMIR